MTTFINFVPSNVAPFSFSPTLDGITYNCVVAWNLFGRRYYVNCFDLVGNRIFSVPLIGSPAGLVLQSLDWEEGVTTATCIEPHNYVPGSTIALTISGVQPDGFNGNVNALIVDIATFSYPLAVNPGPLVAAGNASRNVNLAGGYFNSALVYRAPSRQFEISP